jgi:hypothetical protein
VNSVKFTEPIAFPVRGVVLVLHMEQYYRKRVKAGDAVSDAGVSLKKVWGKRRHLAPQFECLLLLSLALRSWVREPMEMYTLER